MIKKITSEKILNILSHPVFLAGVLSFSVFLILPQNFTKYKLELLSSERVLNENTRNEYHDINSDGLNERLLSYNLPTNATIVAFSHNESVYESWNLPGHWFTQPDYTLYDYSKDGISELYGLNINNGDSLLVSQVNLIKKNQDIKTKFVCQLQKFNGKIDQVMSPYGFTDITGDSIKDFVFFVSAGFALQPRSYYAWDIKNDTILKSPLAGMNYKNVLQNTALNIDMETGDEIFLINAATDNYKTFIPYSDTASYAVVYTKNLNYLFPPVYCAGPQSHTFTFPFIWKNKKQILAITKDFRKKDHNTTFRIINLNGIIIFEKQSDLFDNNFKPVIINNNICMQVYDANETLFGILDEDLNFTKKIAFKEDFKLATSFNADDDPQAEFLFINAIKNEFGILQDDYKNFTSTEMPIPITELQFISLKSSKNGCSEISIQLKGINYHYNYKNSIFYPFRFLYYILVYTLSYLFLLGLQKIFTSRSNRKKVLEEKMINYQLQSIMNQLNPHFTFNAINSIGGAIIDGKNVEAYEYFTKLSNLIRKSMTNAFQTSKSLGEEIDFVKEYLEIEKYRFEEKLNWELSIDPSVDMQTEIPKMLIHIFVENAIKHGIFHMTESGNIDIKILNNNSHLEILITDDGVGMSKAFEIEQHKGKGLIILNNYLELFNVKQKSKISYKIKDRSKINKEITGTEIIIKIA